MLDKYSTILNRRPATTHIYAIRTYFSPRQTSTANVTKPFLCKPAHPLRLNIDTLQNLPSCFHTSRFKSITSIHCQRPLQKHVNNHIDNVNGVTFVACKHMSPQGPIFISAIVTLTCLLPTEMQLFMEHLVLPVVCLLLWRFFLRVSFNQGSRIKRWTSFCFKIAWF